MGWLNPDEMKKWKVDFCLYIVRRKDNGQYYKTVKSSFLKNWKEDDPRRSHWTDDVEMATTYTLSGIKNALAVAKRSTWYYVKDEQEKLVKSDVLVEMEIITLHVKVDLRSEIEPVLDLLADSAMKEAAEVPVEDKPVE